MKYVIAAVPFSDNLGDGVIADNIKSFLHRHNCSDVEVCDISYRSKVSTFKSKGSLMRFFVYLPRFIRQFFVLIFFSIKYFRTGKRYLYRKISGRDQLLIGGGQLISDVDLNFPLKLYFLIKVAERFDVETRVVSVGVANKWSWLGKLMIKRVLKSRVVANISVRDELSKHNLREYFGIQNVHVLPDPALMSSLVGEYKCAGLVKSNTTVLGLGVANVEGLNYSSDIANSYGDNDAKYIASIVRKSNEVGVSVSLFTNGASEDEAYLHENVIPLLDSERLIYSCLSRSEVPGGLVKNIRQFDFVIAYRLHANILAISFNIPSFAVGWDSKVVSFFEAQGRDGFVYKSLKSLDKNYNEILQAAQGARFLGADLNKVEAGYIRFLGVDLAD